MFNFSCSAFQTECRTYDKRQQTLVGGPAAITESDIYFSITGLIQV